MRAASSARAGIVPLRTTITSAGAKRILTNQPAADSAKRNDGADRKSQRNGEKNNDTKAAKQWRAVRTACIVRHSVLRAGWPELLRGIGARAFDRPAAHQQPAQTEQHKARLAQADSPEDLPGLVARILAQRTLGRIVEQVDEAAVVGLLKTVQRPAQQEMQIELAAQGAQFAARAAARGWLPRRRARREIP